MRFRRTKPVLYRLYLCCLTKELEKVIPMSCRLFLPLVLRDHSLRKLSFLDSVFLSGAMPSNASFSSGAAAACLRPFRCGVHGCKGGRKGFLTAQSLQAHEKAVHWAPGGDSLRQRCLLETLSPFLSFRACSLSHWLKSCWAEWPTQAGSNRKAGGGKSMKLKLLLLYSRAGSVPKNQDSLL